MPFLYQIRPVSLEHGFDLACEGVLPVEVRHPRLIDAIVHAAQLGCDMDGQIQIFDAAGKLMEALPLPSRLVAAAP